MFFAACGVPVTSPQLAGLSRAVNEPREERNEVYKNCIRNSVGQEAVIECMKKGGFGFLAEPAYHRIEHCRLLLKNPDAIPEAFCFQKIKAVLGDPEQPESSKAPPTP
jgi:hypothetical protein